MAKDVINFQIPGITVPGGGGGRGVRMDTSFTDRLDRKERQKALDAENLRRFEIGQARLEEAKRIQAEDRMYQRGREAVRDGYAADAHNQAAAKFGWAKESHGWAGENHADQQKLNDINIDKGQFSLDKTKQDRAAVEGFAGNVRDVNTEMQDEINNKFIGMNEAVANGVMTQKDVDEYTQDLITAIDTGKLQPDQVTNEQQYRTRIYNEALQGGMMSDVAAKFADDAVAGASKASALAAEQYKYEADEIKTTAKFALEENKKAQQPGVATGAGVRKLAPNVENVGNKWFGSYKGMTQGTPGKPPKFKGGGKVGSQELDKFVIDIAKADIGYEFDKNGVPQKFRKPTESEIAAAISGSLDNGGVFGAMADFIDADAVYANLEAEVRNRGMTGVKVSSKGIIKKSKTDRDASYSKSMKKTAEKKLADSLKYNKHSKTNTNP